MSRTAWRTFLPMLAVVAGAVVATAQRPPESVHDRPKVGLVLSGGGVRGVAHIALLEAIEELGIPVDLVVGTSMGSVVGGLYAAGYDASELEEMVEEIDWNQLLSDVPERRYLTMEEKLRDGVFIGSVPLNGLRAKLPSGLIAGQRVAETLARLTWPVHHVRDFSELPIPFACVATDVETGEAVRIENGHLAEAMRASMSFPSVFTPKALDGRLLIDGGVVRNLPAEDARALGADVVICSDVSKPLSVREELDSIISIMEQTFNFKYWEAVEEQRGRCDLVITPKVGAYSTFSFGDWEKILEEARNEVDNNWMHLVAIADSLGPVGTQRTGWIPAAIDSVSIAEIRVEGLDVVPQRVVTGQMDIEPPQWASIDDLERDINRIYSTRFFERVTYVIEPSDTANSSRLIIRVQERTDNELRFGFRYDARSQARMLLNAVYRNIISRGSKLSLQVEVGETLSFSTDYFLKFGLRRRAGVLARSRIERHKFDEYVDGEPVTQISSNLARAELGLATLFSTQGYTGLTLIAEYSRTGPRITSLPDTDDLHAFMLMPALTVWHDTFDQLAFPTKGTFLFMRSVVAHPDFGSDVEMTQHRLLFSHARELTEDLVLMTDLEFAATFGDRAAIPGHWRLALGGDNKGPFETGRFAGLDLNERTGRYISKIGGRLRVTIKPRRYLTLTGNAGMAGDEGFWEIRDKNDVVLGYGVGFGMATVVGPIELTLTGGNSGKLGVFFNLGHRFGPGF